MENYNKKIETINSSNWNYLDISDRVINDRYSWFKVYLPPIEKQFPWAYAYDINRLFLLSRTFDSKEKAINWMEANLTNELMPIHKNLIDSFCYSDKEFNESLEEFIEKTNQKKLLFFIQQTLERSLFYYDTSHCWPGYYRSVLFNTSKQIGKGFKIDLENYKKGQNEGFYLITEVNHSQIFYKFDKLIEGLSKGKILYNIYDLSRQVHATLLTSIKLFIDYKYRFLNKEQLEIKINEIKLKETNWCKNEIQKLTMKDCETEIKDFPFYKYSF